ncbi:hypothetical protein Dda_8299 [Drechslerella dactyloides]|uniref:Uncharacterized protein n=1 Tax=Drechslerella dactyloides TaxID=74499 RepID=A0AAD6NGH2_DREDA|nr:hypothetical protein Dda_8299 [Drechslerella dactyloides]
MDSSMDNVSLSVEGAMSFLTDFLDSSASQVVDSTAEFVSRILFMVVVGIAVFLALRLLDYDYAQKSHEENARESPAAKHIRRKRYGIQPNGFPNSPGGWVEDHQRHTPSAELSWIYDSEDFYSLDSLFFESETTLVTTPPPHTRFGHRSGAVVVPEPCFPWVIKPTPASDPASMTQAAQGNMKDSTMKSSAQIACGVNDISGLPKGATLKSLALKTRQNRIQTEAELQELEDCFRRDLVQRGLLADPSLETPESPIETEMLRIKIARALELLKDESSQWVLDEVAVPKEPTTKTTGDDLLGQMIKLAAYHSTPEYQAKQADLTKGLELAAAEVADSQSRFSTDFGLLPTGPRSPTEETRPFNTAEFFLEKHQEHLELTQTFKSIESERKAAQEVVDMARKYFEELPRREAQRLKDQEERHKRNMAALEEKFAAEDRAKAELIRSKAEAERRRVEEQRLAAEKAKREAELQRENERRAKEQKEQREREEAERQRLLAEQQRLLAQQELERQQQEAAAKAKQEAERRQKALNEQAAKARKSQEDDAFRQAQVATNPQGFEAEIAGQAQKMVSTMPYLSPGALDYVKGALAEQIGYRHTYLAAMARMAPSNATARRSSDSMAAAFEQYARTRYNMEFVLIRSKAIKVTYRSRDLTDLKYKMAKRATQMVGSKAGYFNAAKELIKLLSDVAANLEAAGGVSNIAVVDFTMERQPKEAFTAPPVLFLALYNFTKTILTKAIAEGPDDAAMLKALAMTLNSIVGGRAKYWPAVAVTSLIYARFWDFSASLFGAMGKESDLGYKEGDTTTDVNRRAEVVAALFCHMAIIRPANIRREQAIVIDDVKRCIDANLNVPPYLRTELHYINIRTIMKIAPWTLRAHIGYEGVVNLDAKIRAICREDVGTKLKGFATLLYNHMDQLQSEGYTNQARRFGCDEWRYWDLDELADANTKRASVEQIHGEQVEIDAAVTRNRIQAIDFKVPELSSTGCLHEAIRRKRAGICLPLDVISTSIESPAATGLCDWVAPPTTDELIVTRQPLRPEQSRTLHAQGLQSRPDHPIFPCTNPFHTPIHRPLKLSHPPGPQPSSSSTMNIDQDVDCFYPEELDHDHDPGPAPALSNFERLPGEIRNEIYAYLLHPARNTSYDRSPQNANLYGYWDQTPTDIDDDDDEDELKVYQVTAPKMERVRLHPDILLANRRIYREAHSFLYTACGPVLAVRGVPYNTLVCTLMSRLGFRPFYTQRVLAGEVSGCVAVLDLKWDDIARLDAEDDEEEPYGDFEMYNLTDQQPSLVLIQPQIADFVRLLQILKIRDIHESEMFILNFDLLTPSNIFGEPIGDDAYVRQLHEAVFDDFSVFRGTGIIYSVNAWYQEPDYATEFVRLVNQPIMWLRSEILRLAELFDSIAQQDSHLGDQDPIDEFCRWVFIGHLIRNKIEKSYPRLADFHPLVEELQPVDLLHQILQISFYNISRCLFMMVMRNSLPEALEISDPNDALRDLCEDLEEITKQVMDVESPGEETLEVPVLTRDQISMVYHLEGTICLHCHSKEAELIEEAHEFFRSSVEYAEGERKEALEKLVAGIQELTLDEDGNVPMEFMELVVSTLPQGPMHINIPTEMKSFRVDYERRILKEYGYKGSLLEERFLQDPPEEPDSMGQLQRPPGKFDLEVYHAVSWRRGKKVWLGSGTKEIFVEDDLDDLDEERPYTLLN